MCVCVRVKNVHFCWFFLNGKIDATIKANRSKKKLTKIDSVLSRSVFLVQSQSKRDKFATN